MGEGRGLVGSGQWAVDGVCLAATRRGAGRSGLDIFYITTAYKAATIGRDDRDSR
jgi:hypothetical protein